MQIKISSLAILTATATLAEGGYLRRLDQRPINQSLRRQVATSGDNPEPINTFPYSTNCEHTTGLDFQRGCIGNPFAETLSPCKDPEEPGPCIETSHSTSGTGYTSNVQNTEQKSVVISDVASVEGSYNSFKGSLSANYMSDSEMKTTAITFTIGQAEQQKLESIRGFANMKLTEKAMDLLRNDADSFLNTYGKHFIVDIGLGASFFGSLNVFAKESTSSTSLEAFAQFSASEMFNHISASNNFTMAVNTAGESVTVEANAVYSGADGPADLSGQTPIEIGEFFNNTWKELIKNGGAKMTMGFAQYAQLKDVDNYLTLECTNQTVIDMFQSPPPMQQTTIDLQNEIVQCNNLLTTVKSTLDWSCLDNDTSSKLSQLSSDIYNHLTTLHDEMSEAFMLEVENGQANNVYMFSTYNEDYNTIMESSSCILTCPTADLMKHVEDVQCFKSGESKADYHNTYGCDDSKFMTGMSYTHTCGENQAYEEYIAAQCQYGTPPGFSLNTPKVYTPWLNTGNFATNTCPEGYAVTAVYLTHECGLNDAAGRYTQLVCQKPPDGYALGDPSQLYVTEWVEEINCDGNYNNNFCHDGDVMVGVDFSDQGSNSGNAENEKFRIWCQRITGPDLYCSA